MLGLLDFANKWVERGGLIVLAIIVFAESGLLVGFFLPGDSLLFSAGLLASQDVFNMFWLNVVLMVAAVVGDAVNGGVYGTVPALNDLDSSKNLKFQIDFRRVYATIIDKWLLSPGSHLPILNDSFSTLGFLT